MGTVETSRRELGGLLWRLADMVRATETRRSFRSKAFHRAVWSLDDLPPDLRVTREDALAVPGVGKGVAALIDEYLSEGHLRELVVIENAFPHDSPALRRLPRMNPQILLELKASLGVETRNDLRVAIESDSLGAIRGVGPTTISLWAEILSLAPADPNAVPAHRGWVLASTLAGHVGNHTGTWIDIGGEVRRIEEWVHRIDLVACSDSGERLESFLETSAVLADVEWSADTFKAHAHSGTPVHIVWTQPEAAGTVLARVTGPDEHLDHLSDDLFPTENELYHASGFPLIPAPARILPIDMGSRVVARQDVRGDLHLHSDSSPDGRMTLEELFAASIEEGHEYVLITDHTRGLRFGGLDDDAIHEQAAVVDSLRRRFPELVVLHGAEVNIGADGSLDLADETLEELDFVVAGLHSYFGMTPDEQTKRLEAALEHPAVRVLAHPLGRRIGVRPAIDVDMDRLIDAAIRNDVALETNGHRDRLDLGAPMIELAADKGALFAANSDAHRRSEMGNVANAVGTLQRAGVDAEKVVNTWEVERLQSWIGGVTPDRRAANMA